MWRDLIRKDGQILVGKSENSIYMLPPCKVAGHGRMTKVVQWVDLQKGGSWWLLDGLRTSMLWNLDYQCDFRVGDNITFIPGGKSYPFPVIFESDEPVILYADAIFNSGGAIYMLNREGKCLSGSNTWQSGNLCLGDQFNPFNQHPVQLLLTNTANGDLGWFGECMEGSIYKDGSNLIFKAYQWTPHTHEKRDLPSWLKGDLDALLQL